MTGDTCENTKPMEEWIKDPTSRTCRVCFMEVILDWYVSELDEKGRKDESDKLRDMVEKKAMADEVARELDAIKERVEPELKSRLKEFDCAFQANEPTELEADQPEKT